MPFPRRSQVAQDLNQDGTQPHPKETSFTRALKRAHLHGPTWDRGQLLTAAIPINEEREHLQVQLGHRKVQRDTMTAQLRACKVRFKQQQHWFTKNGKHSAQAAWLPSLLDKQLEVDHIPFQDLGVFYRLGFDASNGHYCNDIKDGGTWWVYDDANDAVKPSALAWVAQENCCLPWLHCTPQGRCRGSLSSRGRISPPDGSGDSGQHHP